MSAPTAMPSDHPHPDAADDVPDRLQSCTDAVDDGDMVRAGNSTAPARMSRTQGSSQSSSLQPADDPAGDDGDAEPEAEIGERDLPADQPEQQDRAPPR